MVYNYISKYNDDMSFLLMGNIRLMNFTSCCWRDGAGKVVIPQRGTETFISSIGQMDGRVELCNAKDSLQQIGEESGNKALMDLCIMSSKLAYENAKVVQRIVNHWEASNLFLF